MYIIEVGKPYSAIRSSWAEGVEYNFTKEGHQLRIFMNFNSKGIKVVKEGGIKFALAVEGDILLFMFEIGGLFDWSDCPYSIQMVKEELRLEAPELGENERAILQIVLVEAKSGILKAIREVTFSHDFSVKLHEAINKQIGKPITRASYNEQVKRIQTQIPIEILLSRTIARCKGGD